MSGDVCEVCCCGGRVASGPCAACGEEHYVCDACSWLLGLRLEARPGGWEWPFCPEAGEIAAELMGRA